MTSSTAHTAAPRTMWPALLCWVTVMLEGYDLVVLGAIIPTLTKTGYAGFDAAGATAVATLSLVGVAIGAAAVGPITDRFGRRIVLLGSILLFSLFTLVIPLAGSVGLFATFRLIAGLGLGACMPTALTFMAEHMPAESRARASTFTMTGYHVGAVITSLLALAFVPNWQPLFYAGGIIGLLILPLMWVKLPESEAFLQAKAKGVTRVPFSTLVGPQFRRASIGVWIGSFMGLLLVYGLNTWLPKLMNDAGYSMSSSITLLLILNVGAIIGLLAAGTIADRRGTKPTIVVWFVVSAVLLSVLSIRMSSNLLLNTIVLLTGIFVFSAQVLIYAYVTQKYPAEVRGTALGLASAIGRLGAITGPFVTGALVVAGIAYPWGFYFFAAVAVLGFLATMLIPAISRHGDDTTVDRSGAMQGA